jgi:hypothetical protein
MYPVMALVGLMLFTWAAAVWASWQEEQPQAREHSHEHQLKNAA